MLLSIPFPFQQIPGWNEYCKESHAEAREALLLWKSYSSPRYGVVFDLMKKTRAQFKRTLRRCKSNDNKAIADSLARNLLTKDCKQFWSEIQKINSNVTTIATTIDNITGQADIVKMWQSHFKKLLNSCETNSRSTFKNHLADCVVHEDVINVDDVKLAIKGLNSGKSCGVDGLSSEHFKFADDKLCILLKLVFNCMFLHGHLPKDFMNTLIVPIVKNKKGNISDSDNYRPIALTNVASKIMEVIILSKYKMSFVTQSNQFGFKIGHSTDTCVFTMKSVIDYYISLASPVYICYLDASKAFDRVEHCNLFSKLMSRKLPKIVVRLLFNWYCTQMFTIKWGSTYSDPFTVTNGVRQGGVLSPALFNVYIDDLSVKLNKLSTGCNMNNVSFNHLVYADDTVLLAPSPSALQELLNCCEEYSKTCGIIYNVKKTVCMCIKPKSYNDLFIPNIYLGGRLLNFISEQKYLGYIITSEFTDNLDISRQMKCVYAIGNSLVRNFSQCSDDVKLQLFKTYCSNLYCCQLWSNYKNVSYNKLKVAYNNVYRALFKLDRQTSISNSMVLFNVNGFKAVVRKHSFGFRERIFNLDNFLVKTIVESMYFMSNQINVMWTKNLFLM